MRRTLALIGGLLAGTTYCMPERQVDLVQEPAQCAAPHEELYTKGIKAPLDIKNYTHLTEFWKRLLFETSENERTYYDVRDFTIYATTFADPRSDHAEIDDWMRNSLHHSFEHCVKDLLNDGGLPVDDLGRFVQKKATDLEEELAKSATAASVDDILTQTERFFAELKEHVRGRNGGREELRAGFHLYKLYEHDMKQILTEGGVPEDIVYLTFGESQFKPNANSRSNARGVWQIIPGTARQYGLRVSRRVDEREDILRSTEAAAGFLNHLYHRFGKWELAILAYNQGEGNLSRAIQEAGSNDLVDLMDFKEYSFRFVVGKHYIPIFLAAHQGVNAWEQQEVPDEKRFFLDIERDESLRDVFVESGLAAMDVLSVNGDQAHIAINVDEMGAFLKAYHAKDLPHRQHLVRGGETPEGIAKKYNSTVAELEFLNGVPAQDLKPWRRIKVRRRPVDYDQSFAAFVQGLHAQQQATSPILASYPDQPDISPISPAAPDTVKPSLTDALIVESPYLFDGDTSVKTFAELNQDSRINPDPERFFLDIYNSRGVSIRTPPGTMIKIEGDGHYRAPRFRRYASASELDNRIEMIMGKSVMISFQESTCKYVMGPDTKIVLKKYAKNK